MHFSNIEKIPHFYRLLIMRMINRSHCSPRDPGLLIVYIIWIPQSPPLVLFGCGSGRIIKELMSMYSSCKFIEPVSI